MSLVVVKLVAEIAVYCNMVQERLVMLCNIQFNPVIGAKGAKLGLRQKFGVGSFEQPAVTL